MDTQTTGGAAAPHVEWKACKGIHIDAETGRFEAVVATLNVVDHDKDIIVPSAIREGAKVVVSSFGHSAVFGERPAGKGRLTIAGNELVAKGQLFMSTTEGRDTRGYLIEMGEDAEWSFGYIPVQSRKPTGEEAKAGAERVLLDLTSFEVSPVLMGAGIATRTLGVKDWTILPPAEPASATEPVPPPVRLPEPEPEPAPIPRDEGPPDIETKATDGAGADEVARLLRTDIAARTERAGETIVAIAAATDAAEAAPIEAKAVEPDPNAIAADLAARELIRFQRTVRLYPYGRT